jgi:hypothetical protein
LVIWPPARLAAVLTAADVPFNGYGIYRDQGSAGAGRRLVRYRGEAWWRWSAIARCWMA